MKSRIDFVTNSSSSSFIIAKRHLDSDQLEAIRYHEALAKKMGMWDEGWDDAWFIRENKDYITGHVSMDNFDMYTFLERIEVDPKHVNWGEFSFDLNTYRKNDSTKEDDLDEETELSWRELL